MEFLDCTDIISFNLFAGAGGEVVARTRRRDIRDLISFHKVLKKADVDGDGIHFLISDRTEQGEYGARFVDGGDNIRGDEILGEGGHSGLETR